MESVLIGWQKNIVTAGCLGLFTKWAHFYREYAHTNLHKPRADKQAGERTSFIFGETRESGTI